MGLEDYKPIIVLIACQFAYAGIIVIGRAALLEDLSSRVFVVYRQSMAFLLIAPIAFCSRRGPDKRRGLTWKSFCWIFLMSFVSVTLYQNAYYEGMYLASSSVASALNNSIVAITFIMAYALGLEKVHTKSLRSIAKVIGTVICVSGAAAMGLIEGPKLINAEFHPRNSHLIQGAGEHGKWLLGFVLLLASASCWSLGLILQVPVTARHPDHLSLTAWMCLIGALQSAVVTLIIEGPNLDTWKLTSPLQLFSCFYAGFASAFTFFAQAWCVSKRGPVFYAMFNPLCTVIVTIFACAFLHEELYTGSLTGGLAVIIGLYILLWGKAKDHEDMRKEETIPSQIQKQNDRTTFISATEVSDNISCTIDLEEPLLNEIPNLGCDSNK